MSRSAPVADACRASSSSSTGQPQQPGGGEPESIERPDYGHKDVSAWAERGRAEVTAEVGRVAAISDTADGGAFQTATAWLDQKAQSITRKAEAGGNT